MPRSFYAKSFPCLQVSLLGLPWSKELEDGGGSVLSENPDWASLQRQTVDDYCKEILHGICDQTGTSLSSVSLGETHTAAAAENQNGLSNCVTHMIHLHRHA